MKTFTTVQPIVDEYIETVTAAYSRWSHRKGLTHQVCGGHYGRTAYKAIKLAEKRLAKLGYTNDNGMKQVLQDMRDLAALERNSDV